MARLALLATSVANVFFIPLAAQAVVPDNGGLEEWVLVDTASDRDGYELLSRGVKVVEVRQAFALARVGPGEWPALAPYRYEKLGTPASPVYLAWPKMGKKGEVPAGVQILAKRGDTYIITATAAGAAALSSAGWELKNVAPKPAVRPKRRLAYAAVEYDDRVASLVRRVSPERYYEHIQNLAAIPTRYSLAAEIEQATAYIEEHFKKVGLATERRPYEFRLTDNDYLLDCIFRPGGARGWLVSTWGYVWRTADHGVTWTPYEVGGRLNEGKFVTDTRGFVVGGQGFMARTDDGGRTWEEIALGDPKHSLHDIYFYDDSLAVAVGWDGAIERTADGGNTWKAVASPTQNKLTACYAETAEKWWAVGDKGTVLKSDDGGRTWYKVVIPEAGTTTLRQIAFADATHAVIVGYEGLILYSDDGGATWTRVSGSYPTWPYFTDVSFADATRGWAVGSEGKIYRTDDAGATWTRQNQPLGEEYTFEAVCAVSREEAWASGYPTALVHTTDGGATWRPVTLTAPEPIIWYNVEATLPGVTNPDEVYILCAHYDCMSEEPWRLAPGAEDNASGAAALLEAASALRGSRFDATLRFVAFSGEEQGLFGSRAYVEQEYGAGADIRAAFNMDMISYLDEPVHDMETRYNSFSEELLEALRAAATTYVPEVIIYPTTGGFGGSDHESFWHYGYPALLSIEYAGKEFYPWYHTTQDLPYHLTPEFGANVLRVNLAAAATLARPREGAAPSSRGVIAYPNPARPARGHEAIRFANLAPGSRLEVYDLAGKRLWSTAVGPAGAAEWAIAAIAPGVYLYHIADPSGETFSGKVAVIK